MAISIGITCMFQAFKSWIAIVPTPPEPPNTKTLLFLLEVTVFLQHNAPVIHNADHAVRPAYNILAASMDDKFLGCRLI